MRKKRTQEIILASAYIALAVVTRTIFHIAPNIEFITATSLCAGFLFKNKRLVVLIPFISLAITDAIIGNSTIFIFTWSGFLLVPTMVTIFRGYFDQLKTKKFAVQLLSIQFTGLFSTIIFYLWTNFGVVITTSMYPNTLNGLTQSYINALPFLYNQLAGNLIIVPVIFISTYIFLSFSFRAKLSGVKILSLNLLK